MLEDISEYHGRKPSEQMLWCGVLDQFLSDVHKVSRKKDECLKKTYSGMSVQGRKIVAEIFFKRDMDKLLRELKSDHMQVICDYADIDYRSFSLACSRVALKKGFFMGDEPTLAEADDYIFRKIHSKSRAFAREEKRRKITREQEVPVVQEIQKVQEAPSNIIQFNPNKERKVKSVVVASFEPKKTGLPSFMSAVLQNVKIIEEPSGQLAFQVI